MELKFDDKQFKKVMAELLFAQLTEEHRKEIFTKAIEGFFEKDRRGSGSSQMDRIIEKSMQEIAREVVVAYIKDSTFFTEKLQEAVEEGVQKAFEGEAREKIIEKVISGVQSVIGRGY